MPLAQYYPSFPTVIIQGDWTTAAEILADVEAGWGMAFRTDVTYSIVVWEGPSDSDDWALYTITNGDTLAIVVGFASTPVAGTTVYITDIWFS